MTKPDLLYAYREEGWGFELGEFAEYPLGSSVATAATATFALADALLDIGIGPLIAGDAGV